MHLALVIGVFTVGQTLEGFLLVPWLVGDSIGMHPVAVIFAIMAGGQLFGFLGVLLALPVAAVAMVLLRYAHEQYTSSHLYVDDEEDPSPIILSAHDAARRRALAPRRVSPQLPLSLRFPPDQRLAFFSGRDDVREMVAAVADGSRSDWLYLAGPAGSGKTHLLLAACAQAQAHDRRAVYLPMAALAGRVESALAGQDEAGLVCLDGLDAIAGQRDDEVALFHFHNRMRAGSGRLVYAASAMPAALPFVLPDLRVAPGAMHAPGAGAAGRRRRAGTCCASVPRAVAWSSTRPCSTICSGASVVTWPRLTGLLDRLDRESLAAQRRITVPFLRGVLDGGKKD